MEGFELVGGGLAVGMLCAKRETYMASAHVLLAFDVVVDDFKEESALLSDCFDNIFERFLVETYWIVNNILCSFAPTAL